MTYLVINESTWYVLRMMSRFTLGRTKRVTLVKSRIVNELLQCFDRNVIYFSQWDETDERQTDLISGKTARQIQRLEVTLKRQ